jgi:hypothetical protein
MSQNKSTLEFSREGFYFKKPDDNIEDNSIICILCKKVEDPSCKKCSKITFCLDKSCSMPNGNQHTGCKEYLISGCQNCFQQTKNANFCNDCYIKLRDVIINTNK